MDDFWDWHVFRDMNHFMDHLNYGGLVMVTVVSMMSMMSMVSGQPYGEGSQ